MLASLVFITNVNANTNTNTNIDMKVGPERLKHNANIKYQYKKSCEIWARATLWLLYKIAPACADQVWSALQPELSFVFDCFNTYIANIIDIIDDCFRFVVWLILFNLIFEGYHLLL